MEGNGAAAILLQYKQGSNRAFDALVSHLADPNVQKEVLIQCLVGLKDCSTLLGRDTEHLVGVILKVDWLHRGRDVITAYQDFIINLVSARTMYLRACLKMIIKQFIPKIDRSAVVEDRVHVDEMTRQAHSCDFSHLHDLLRRIVTLVPITNTVVLQVLSEYFPYVSKEAYVQACYVHNLLVLVGYVPHLRAKVLELIADKVIKLDVRSPRHAIEDSTSDESDDEMDIFEMDNLDEGDRVATTKTGALSKDSVGEEDRLGAGKEDSSCTGEEIRPMTLKEADSLDSVMDVMFHFIHNTCFKNDILDWEATKKLYRELLLIFDKIILPTHASSHVQFIMFYICSFKDLLAEGFIDYLWKKVCNPSTQPIFRQAAVAYLAGFLSRAKYVQINNVTACLDLMVAWIHSYIQRTAETCTVADVDHHGPFYSVCQAVFYVVAFRHKGLLAMPNGYKYCQGLNLQTVVTCRLNPLRVCLPIVARTFSTITRNQQLAYCDSILEKNRRQTLPEASSGSSGMRLTHLNPLDSFFPFDPYLLVRSKKFIKDKYQVFEGSVQVEQEASDEDEHYEEKNEEDSQYDFEMEQSVSEKGRIMAESPTDLLAYGISPGFKTFH